MDIEMCKIFQFWRKEQESTKHEYLLFCLWIFFRPNVRFKAYCLAELRRKIRHFFLATHHIELLCQFRDSQRVQRMFKGIFLQQFQHTINNCVGGRSEAFRNFGPIPSTETQRFICLKSQIYCILSERPWYYRWYNFH